MRSYAIFTWLACAALLLAAREARSDGVRSVRTAQELQAAFGDGVKHVVINEHLDLTGLSVFAGVGLDDGVLATTGFTQTVRGNCSQPADVANPPATTRAQCVLRVREDWLEMTGPGSRLLLAELYVQLVAAPARRANALLVRVAEGALYMANVTLKGDGRSCRGVDVGDGARLYATGTMFTGFEQPSGAGVRIGERALATFSNCAFRNNVAAVPQGSAVPAHGPALTLLGGTEGGTYSAVWLQGCEFTDNRAETRGAASVERQACRVFSSDPEQPEVFIVSRGETRGPWALKSGGSETESAGGVRFAQLQFPSSEDPFVLRTLRESATMTGLPRASLPPLPQPSTLAAERPSVRARYTPVGGGGDNDRLRLAVILALACLGLVLCCVAAAALVVCRRTLRGRAEDPYAVTPSDKAASASSGQPVWRKNLVAGQSSKRGRSGGVACASGSGALEEEGFAPATPVAPPLSGGSGLLPPPPAQHDLVAAAPRHRMSPAAPQPAGPTAAPLLERGAERTASGGVSGGGVSGGKETSGSNFGSGFGSSFGPLGGPMRPPVPRYPLPPPRSGEAHAPPRPVTPGGSARGDSGGGTPTTGENPAPAALYSTLSNPREGGGGPSRPASEAPSLYATCPPSPAGSSSHAAGAPAERAAAPPQSSDSTSQVAGGYITRLPSLPRQNSDTASAGPRSIGARSAGMRGGEGLTSLNMGAPGSLPRTTSRARSATGGHTPTSGGSSAFHLAAAAAVAVSAEGGAGLSSPPAPSAPVHSPPPSASGRSGPAGGAGSPRSMQDIDAFSPFAGDAESPRTDSLDLAIARTSRAAAAALAAAQPPPDPPAVPPQPEAAASEAPVLRAMEAAASPAPEVTGHGLVVRDAAPVFAERSVASTVSMDFGPSATNTLSSTGALQPPERRTVQSTTPDLYTETPVARGPPAALVVATPTAIPGDSAPGSAAPAARTVQRPAGAAGSGAYVPPAPGLQPLVSPTPIVGGESSTDPLAGMVGAGLSGAVTQSTSALLGSMTARLWTGRLGESGMLVAVDDAGDDLSGAVTRHRYRNDAGAAGDTDATTQSVECTVTAAELQGMLREVADRGAIFDGRYALAKGKGSAVQRKGRHSVLHFAARAAPAPSCGGRAAAVPPPAGAAGARGDVALRFYLARPAYNAVRELYSAPDTRACMPAVKELVPNARGVATGEHVLPPCVVSRRGESLAAWTRRAQPDRAAMVRALADIADALAALHAQGLVYYALKPSDVIRLDGPTPWALADFSAVVRQGAQTSPMAIMQAAAPEVVHAAESSNPLVEAHAATDIWALGVMAYELLTSGHVFPVGTPQEAIRNAIFGVETMPWEESSDSEELSPLQASVAACFARDVAQRPKAAKLAETWRRLLRGDDGTAQAEALQAAAQGSDSSGSSEIRVEADSSVLQW